MGDFAVEFYVSDPDFFRPLLRFLFGVSDAELRPAFMNKGVRHWHAVALAIWQSGDLVGHVSPEDFASMINTRSEEHTSELQSLMRISYAVFCLQKKNKQLMFAHNSLIHTNYGLLPSKQQTNITL